MLLAAAPAWGFDAGGVSLGDPEGAVRQAYPEARCQAMEWRTEAADRRCDAAPVPFGGAPEARLTFFLRKDAVQAFDLRFDARDLAKVTAHLKARYGVPDTERTETFERRGEKRQVRKLRWAKGEDRAVLSAQVGRRHAELNVWRGDFDTEVYELRERRGLGRTP
jgi:hypothetical protein